MNVAIVDSATRDWLRQQQQLPDAIIYRSIAEPALQTEFPQIRWIDYTSNLSESMHAAYFEVRKWLEEIRKRRQDFFDVGGYDYFEALNREMFWVYFDHLLAEFASRKLGQAKLVYDYRQAGKKRGWLRLMKWRMLTMQYALGFKRSSLPAISGKGKIAIRTNNPDVFPMLGGLPGVLGAENVLYFACNPLLPDKLAALGVKNLFLAAPTKPAALLARARTAVRCIGMERGTTLMHKFLALQQAVTRYEHLCKSGVKTILINAGENEGEGDILAQAAKKSGVRSANFMNGTKNFDPVNQNTQFDLWFMHDKQMQEMAASVYRLDPQKLPVVGHLLEDEARSYKYSGLLDRFFTNGRPRFIIAYFPSDLFYNENSAAYAEMQEFLKDKKDVMVFVKPHPRDKDFLWDRKDPRIIRLDFRKENLKSETILFDLLGQSDLSVSIASTVSAQAAWFGIPSVTFELSERSRLTNVDGVRVKHINSAAGLREFLESAYLSSLGRNKTGESGLPEKTVAEKMAAFLK